MIIQTAAEISRWSAGFGPGGNKGLSFASQILKTVENNMRLKLTRTIWTWAVISATAMAASGCVRVPISEQALVSKPNMLFDDSLAFAYQAKLLAQTEPGSGFSAGGKAAGCTSCR